MKTPTLKNIVRREIRDASGNVVSWEVLDMSGNTVPACSLFIRKLEGYAFATQKRYVEAVCKFVDYLYECGILGCFGDNDTLPSRQRVAEAIDAYVPLLLRGSATSIDILIADKATLETNQWKIRAFKTLNIKPCRRKSLDNVIAALNLFLRHAESLSLEAHDQSNFLGIKLPTEYPPLINAVDDGFSKTSSIQHTAIRSASLPGSVIRTHGAIKCPSDTSFTSQKLKTDQQPKDFPVIHMDSLLAAATSWRDRALWLLLLASGIRKSEALNLQWSDIDIALQRVYVLDPHGRRYGRHMTEEEKIRFKGRTVSRTYLWEPWRSRFFHALAEYREREWRIPNDGNGFVFQILKVHEGKVGVPLAQSSDAATNHPFKKAVIKAGIPGPDVGDEDQWTPQSLRHAYGVYMLNYIPIAPGVFGLPEADVQCLMGDGNINSTRKYARR